MENSLSDKEEVSEVNTTSSDVKHSPFICQYISKPDETTNLTLRERFELLDDKNAFPEFKRKLSNNTKINKVTEECVFEGITDEELWLDIEKKKNDISKFLNICFEPSCTNSRCKNCFFTITNKKVGSTCLWGSINLYLSDIYTTSHLHNNASLESCSMYKISVRQILQVLNKYNKHMIIVDIYRPIFDICLSNFFNSFSIYFVREFDKDNKNDMKIIMNRFNDIFISLYDKYNIDYYKNYYQLNNDFTHFDFQKKHLVHKEENINYIKLRLCDSAEWECILTPFLKRDFKITTYNETEDKYIGELYSEFKKQYKIPKNYYQMISENEQFLFYYTKEEQTNYLNKFTDRILENEYLPYTLKELSLHNRIIHENIKDPIDIRIKAMNTNSPIVNNCICESCMGQKKVFTNLVNALNNLDLQIFN